MFTTQSEKIAARLRRDIASGTFPPGKPLALRQIAARMATSIIPVRDALARLQQEGLVEGSSGRGWRVQDLGEEHLGDLAVLREALECQVARLCAERATDDEVEELALLARQADRAKEQARSEAAEGRFHLRLAAVAGSREILTAIERARVLQLTFGPARPETSRSGLHARIIAAIARRDPDAAENEMRRHLTSGMAHKGRYGPAARTLRPDQKEGRARRPLGAREDDRRLP